jgi:hypothetical protein
VVIVNTSRVVGLDATDPFQLSRAETIGRAQCVQIFRFLRKYAPGFERAIRMDTGGKIGVRESRHVVGRYVLTARDLLDAREFADAIALGGYPMDIHSPDADTTSTGYLRADACYQIPLRALLVETLDNLIVVGRCISATHAASAAIRVTPIAMAIGQAGGVLAAEAAGQNLAPAKVAFADVRTRLLAQGAKLPAATGTETRPGVNN